MTYHIFDLSNINEFLIGRLVKLSLSVVKGIPDVINSDSVDPIHDRIEFLLFLFVLQENMIVLDDVEETLINFHF